MTSCWNFHHNFCQHLYPHHCLISTSTCSVLLLHLPISLPCSGNFSNNHTSSFHISRLHFLLLYIHRYLNRYCIALTALFITIYFLYFLYVFLFCHSILSFLSLFNKNRPRSTFPWPIFLFYNSIKSAIF